jgi:hypothetical protein
MKASGKGVGVGEGARVGVGEGTGLGVGLPIGATGPGQPVSSRTAKAAAHQRHRRGTSAKVADREKLSEDSGISFGLPDYDHPFWYSLLNLHYFIRRSL